MLQKMIEICFLIRYTRVNIVYGRIWCYGLGKLPRMWKVKEPYEHQKQVIVVIALLWAPLCQAQIKCSIASLKMGSEAPESAISCGLDPLYPGDSTDYKKTQRL